LAVVGGFTAVGVLAAGAPHPWLGDAVGVVLIYTTLAARDLTRHSRAVHSALTAGDLDEARRRVGMIVGRDTGRLDEPEVARAAVESVAESVVDGVTAPLFFALLFGPLGAMLYRAINTLDSMFGHRDERYRDFGLAAARADDVANWLPARLTFPAIVVAAFLLGLRPGAALRVGLRDHARHPSPNSGWSEAAFAGALGVRLGGVNVYGGVPNERPSLGEPHQTLTPRHLTLANRLMYVASALFLLTGAGVAWGLERWAS
jgi:adenosylcobinamide-phosphate synthase